MSEAAPALPSDASPESLRLLEVARRLAATVPQALARDIAVTGSVSRGLADQHSDIELNIWAEEVPGEAQRAAWLEAAGASELSFDETPAPAGPLWSEGLYADVWVEVGWQSVADLERRIEQILAGEVLTHARLVLAEIVATAVPLRTDGVLSRVRDRLAAYPDVVQRRLLVESIGHWCTPVQRWALLQRGDLFTLAARIADDMHRVLRIVFALNRQWEPDWKWMRVRVHDLEIKPDRLAERLDEIVAAMPSEEAIETSRHLILDTLDLVPASRDVERARDTIQSSLTERAP